MFSPRVTAFQTNLEKWLELKVCKMSLPLTPLTIRFLEHIARLNQLLESHDQEWDQCSQHQ